MRCECCDKMLSDAEATSKFAASGLYTNMCTKCQGFMPKDVKIFARPEEEEPEEDYFDFESAENDDEKDDE